MTQQIHYWYTPKGTETSVLEMNEPYACVYCSTVYRVQDMQSTYLSLV